MMRLPVFYLITAVICKSVFAKNTGFFWQVTDFHYDANYSSTGDPSHMCHQGNNMKAGIGIYGNYLCDAPWLLVTAAIQGMYKIKSDPDFIVWTGDSIPHVDDKDLDPDKVYMLIGNVTDQLRQTFSNTTIYPTLGNHDPYPSNQMPYDTDKSPYYKRILNHSNWDMLLDHEAVQTFLKGGYYMANPTQAKKLRILNLNTNLYYDQDKLTKGMVDPGDQFRWLEDRLNEAKKKNESVYIVAHVPPGMFELVEGMSWFYSEFNRKYLDILLRYTDVIRAQMYGHEHTDSFRILFDKEARPVSPIFLSPAVTPWKSTLPGVGANNPSIRLFEYDRENGHLQRYKQYYLNLTEANILNDPNKWVVEYDTSVDFAIDELNSRQLHELVTAFQNKENHLFKQYLKFNSVQYNTEPVCNDTCFLRHICAITELDFDSYKLCMSGHRTTGRPRSSTHHHHHPTSPPPVPKYMYYVIGGLGACIFILFIIVALLCFNKRRRLFTPRYNKFGSMSVNS